MSIASWNLPPLRAGRAADAALAERRALVGQGAAHQPVPDSVKVTPGHVAGVAVITVEPDDVEADAATIVYLHGGGYRLGTAASWVSFAGRLAHAAGVTVVLVDYRLAPEHPFPAALHDGAAVYDAVHEARGATAAIYLAGDSAGGGLAAAVAVAGVQAGRPAPAGLILLSPWCDLTVQTPSYDSRADTDKMFSREAATSASELYCQGHDPTDPLVSPRLADSQLLSGLPRTLIIAGGDEVLLDDAVGLAGALASARVSVDLHIEAGMQHVFPTLFPDLAESRRAVDTMSRFVRSTR